MKYPVSSSYLLTAIYFIPWGRHADWIKKNMPILGRHVAFLKHIDLFSRLFMDDQAYEVVYE